MGGPQSAAEYQLRPHFSLQFENASEEKRVREAMQTVWLLLLVLGGIVYGGEPGGLLLPAEEASGSGVASDDGTCTGKFRGEGLVCCSCS